MRLRLPGIPRAAAAVLAALALGGAAAAWSAGPQESAQRPSDDELLEALADPQRAGAALQPAFDAFIAAMDRFDGPASVDLARAMHASALRIREDSPGYGVLWSAFCLEGALRRSAPLSGAELDAKLAEARRVLTERLDDPTTTTAEREALLQRRAILEAGIGTRDAERAALGGALALHGIDGAQISGLQRLRGGRPAEAAALFATLLDSADPTRVAAPWALRGHAMAVLDAAP